MQAAIHLYGMDDCFGKKVIIFTSGFLFLLLKSFYDGALTMFFTSSRGVPFKTGRKGLEKFPEWKQIIVEGMIPYFSKKNRGM